MSKHMYYAEIRNKIASKFLNHPDLLEVLDKDEEVACKNEGLSTLCSEAARIFETIQQLSETGNILPVSRAVHLYSDTLVELLLRGEKPLIIDLIVMASQTLQQLC